jgi:hypothetical protein
LEAALDREKRTNYTTKLDGEAEAKRIAIACSQPPEGCSKWSIRLLADRLVEWNIVDENSHMTVQRVLKKTNLTRG